MRLALFTDTLADINGVARFITDMAGCAHAHRRPLRVITSTRKGDDQLPPGTVNIAPTLAMPIPGYSTLDVVWPNRQEIWQAADDFGPTAVHVSTPGPVGWCGRQYARARGLPLAGVWHTDFVSYTQRLYGDDGLAQLAGTVLDWFYKPFDLILARSRAHAVILAATSRVCAPVRVLAAGVDTRRFDATERPADRASGPVRVLYVGRVSAEKNTGLLAQIWPLVSPLQPCGRCELRIVGDGPGLARLRRELGGHADVVCTGFLTGDALVAEYHAADLVVFPSATDTLGQVVMEAQACGLPVVCGSAGGPAQIIADGTTGVVVSSDDAGAWAAVISRLIDDGPLRRSMGHAAAYAMQTCTIERSFSHFWALHSELRSRTNLRPGG